MPAISALHVSLTPQLRRLVAEKVASGRYGSASEVVRAALRCLETTGSGLAEHNPAQSTLGETDNHYRAIYE